MDVFEAVRTVLAVRRYKGQLVPANVVRAIVEAGRLSASSINLQPWHFIVVEYAISDASRAIQNMILTAWADRIGSNWTGFGPMPAVEKLLEVPKTHEGLAIVPFGYPAAKLGRGRKTRKPIREVASRERFGTPFV